MWKSFCLWCCWHLALICTVQGVRMSITPQNVILGTTPSVSQTKTVFTCDSPAGTNINYISDMRITRISQREGDGNRQTIVLIREGRGAEIPQTVTDIQNRATTTGSVDIANRNAATVGLEIDTVAMQCMDVGQYFCELTYDDISGNKHPEEDTMNFTAIALPISTGFTLSATVNGVSRTSSATYPLDMNVGAEIEFSCGGLTGGDPNTQIEWMKSGYSGLIKFNPLSYPNDAVETKGELVPVPDQCTNRRTTKLTYNITSSDRNANNGRLEFMCYAEVTVQGTTHQANSSVFYIQVDGATSPDNGGGTGQSSGTPTSNAGAIAGGVIGAVVFIVIVVLLVYFLWYRRRGGGDTYKTREETDGSNPNLAPSAADLYSQPDKPRSDERPHPKPRGKKKELHYAELDIATNIPMVAPKKSHETVEYAEVKFNNNHDYEHPSNESLEQTVKYGHENRGLDDHDRNNYHEKEKRGRHHRDDYDRDRRGHHNHGMDDDFESRDGGSGVHPSDGPIGTGV